MIDAKHAGNEIGRMIGMDYFPTDQRAVKELVEALRFSLTEVIATAVINEWLQEMTTRPTPADLRRLIAQHNEGHRAVLKSAAEKEPKSYNCKRCDDDGVYGGLMGKGRFDGPWKWCECQAGVSRRARELDEIENERGTDSLGRSPRILDSVNEANQAREKLIRKFGPVPLGAMIRKASIEPDGYHGDF